MSVDAQINQLSTKLALELIPKVVVGIGIPEPITRIVLEALIKAVQEEVNTTDERLRRLVGSYYQSGTDYLSDARRLKGERRDEWIKSALSQFVTASHVEDALLAAKSQFYVGVCYDLLNESVLAREWYERAYTSAYQLAVQSQRKGQQLKQPQQLMNSLLQVLHAYGSTLGIAQSAQEGELTESGLSGGMGQGNSRSTSSTSDILQILRSIKPLYSFYVHPDIPNQKLANAIKACRVQVNEQILGLVDLTVLGSAKSCLLFGANNFYCRDSGSLPQKIAYLDFPGCVFSDEWYGSQWCVRAREADGKEYIILAGSAFHYQYLLSTLNAIRDSLL